VVGLLRQEPLYQDFRADPDKSVLKALTNGCYGNKINIIRFPFVENLLQFLVGEVIAKILALFLYFPQSGGKY